MKRQDQFESYFKENDTIWPENTYLEVLILIFLIYSNVKKMLNS